MLAEYAVTTGLTIDRLWACSRKVFPGGTPQQLFWRIRFAITARRMQRLLSALCDAPPTSPLGRYVAARPAIVLGFIEAPYINACWTADQRIHAFMRQVALVGSLGPVFDFALEESIELPPIEALGPDYAIIIDKPIWSQREGLLTISVFRGNLRLYSATFSIDDVDGKRQLIVGGVQGRSIDGALQHYSELTRLAHGLHPRKLLIEIIRMIGAEIGVTRILAVSNACRHHQHRYFGINKQRHLTLDYDEIWRDRGGVEMPDGVFFELPTHRLVRELDKLDELSPKKRKKRRHQYRFRYPMLDAIEADIRAALPQLRPVVRPAAG